MTKTTRTLRLKFLDSLRRSGIKYGSQNYQDYETGKKLIPAGIITGSEYLKYIRWLTEYVKI